MTLYEDKANSPKLPVVKLESFLKLFGVVRSRIIKTDNWTLLDFVYILIVSLGKLQEALMQNSSVKDFTGIASTLGLKHESGVGAPGSTIEVSWSHPYINSSILIPGCGFNDDGDPCPNKVDYIPYLWWDGISGRPEIEMLFSLSNKVVRIVKPAEQNPEITDLVTIDWQLEERLEEISTEDQEKILEARRTPDAYEIPVKVKGLDNDARILLVFNPLTIDYRNEVWDRARISFTLGIVSTIHPDEWDQDVQSSFLCSLTKSLEASILPDMRSPLKGAAVADWLQIRPCPKAPLVYESPMHLERAMFDFGTTRNLIDKISKSELRRKAKDLLHSDLGLDLSTSEQVALRSLQRIMTEKDHPEILKFTRADYLRAYGVNQSLTVRGKLEFSSGHSKAAMDALESLTTRPHALIWEEKSMKADEANQVRAEFGPLFDRLKSHEGDRKMFVLRPHPIFFSQSKQYYLLKRADTIADIRKKIDRPSKYLLTLVDWMQFKFAAQTRRKMENPYYIKISYARLAQHLRMNTWIEQQQSARIREEIEKHLTTIRSLGWIKSWSVKGDVLHIMLSESKLTNVTTESDA